jgi:hypothetical protein
MYSFRFIVVDLITRTTFAQYYKLQIATNEEKWTDLHSTKQENASAYPSPVSRLSMIKHNPKKLPKTWGRGARGIRFQ